MKTLIIDDEEHCIERLVRLLRPYEKHFLTVLGSATNMQDAIEKIAKLQPDLIFLDVELGQHSAFELLDQLPNINFEIIFVTAYDAYAVKAFKCSALDYLLKPVDEEDLAQAIHKLQQKAAYAKNTQRLESLYHNLKTINAASKRICIPVISGYVFLNIGDIVRCQSDVNYTTIFTSDRKKLVVAKPLKDFEEMLTDFQFYRIHNSHLVNLNYVKSYTKSNGGFVTMTDQSEVSVSTRRKEDFLKALVSL